MLADRWELIRSLIDTSYDEQRRMVARLTDKLLINIRIEEDEEIKLNYEHQYLLGYLQPIVIV